MDDNQYAAARGGRKFLVIVPERRSSPLPITVVVNWLAALQKQRDDRTRDSS